MEQATISHVYSELTKAPNLSTLVERCVLLTEILVDCNSLPQIQPVCRCLDAYLDEVKRGLAESMGDFCVVASKSGEVHPQPKAWLPEETETKCDYCRAINHVLLISHFDRDMLPHLTGLLHDIAHAMNDDLESRSEYPVLRISH
jgi:hypothetical protein